MSPFHSSGMQHMICLFEAAIPFQFPGDDPSRDSNVMHVVALFWYFCPIMIQVLGTSPTGAHCSPSALKSCRWAPMTGLPFP
eukprot:CAMPEP_0201604036 /NCGR_PEP_ID=MMETSP0492-20130828/4299_1 /ASSEMBLY_ACC=CAM_ASM_000837 /TAXON_ID=420259 /ORGANISM="Thalassiosira gravida, Strain GMp14c1" /LENGTH=81 /DNA_ID=CAMNT_0048067965 /DNA_START=776 /DNA_END=1021 /DNA_ORIENTATION=-